MTTLVAGVGELYQGDLDLGRLAADRLAAEGLGPDVLVEDLYYGALAVAQRLEELRPTSLVLVGAVARGRGPGTVERRRIVPGPIDPAAFRAAVEQAGTGYVSMDLVVQVGLGLGVLPRRTLLFEVEPNGVEPAERLSPEAEDALEDVIHLVREEVRRFPLLELADRLRPRLEGDHLEPADAVDAMRALLLELDVVDQAGRWGRTFALRDALRLRIAEGRTGEGMDHLDWGLWWGMIEELDRLQALEGSVL